MEPCSLDLRERVVARVAAGEPVRAVAAAFDVSVSGVVKCSQRWRMTGSAATKPMGGKRRGVMAPVRDHALARLAEEPSLARRASAGTRRARGERQLRRALAVRPPRLAVAQKRTILAEEVVRPDVVHRRARWKRHQYLIDPRRLVFIPSRQICGANRLPGNG